MLITGAQGFLGVRATKYYSERYHVVACNHSDMDITDESSVMNRVSEVRPDVVLHCAAISDTWYTEQHPELSQAVNVQGSVFVAKAARAYDAKMVFMSSDQIYNGNEETFALPETIAVKPENLYGRQKLIAEQKVMEILPSAVGLRLTWMFDVPDSPYAVNRGILLNLFTAAQKHQPVRAAVRELRGITNVWNIIEHFEACFDLPGGIYNYGCTNTLNSYETFAQIARLLHLPSDLIVKDETRYPQHIRNISMDITKLQAYGISFSDTISGVKKAIG